MFVTLLLTGCGELPPDPLIGKWDMTNDPSSKFQKTLEIKEDNVFVETWIIISDNEDEEYVLEIQGEYSLEETDRIEKALCFIYDLESLSDPDGILEALEKENYFAEVNNKYYDAKRINKVYGLQGISATPTRLYYEADAERNGMSYKETREFLRITDSEGEPKQ